MSNKEGYVNCTNLQSAGDDGTVIRAALGDKLNQLKHEDDRLIAHGHVQQGQESWCGCPAEDTKQSL